MWRMTDGANSGRTVFISYSHKNSVWMNRLHVQLSALQMNDVLDVWVDTDIATGDDWKPEIEKALGDCSVAILLVTAEFLTSNFILTEEVPELLRRRHGEGITVYPVICEPCPWKKIGWLSKMQLKPAEGKPLSGFSRRHQWLTELSNIAEAVADIIGDAVQPVSRFQVAPAPDVAEHARGVTVNYSPCFPSKLPATTGILFGRETELGLLDQAWNSPHTRIMMLSAMGGVGKSALVGHWLENMRQESYRGAKRMYGWSFYSQGTSEDRQVGADEFIAHALGWFGDPDPTKGTPWEKGVRLASLIAKERTLLILDGLEPIQYPPGEIRDQGMQALLKELARSGDNQGLCVITTRIPVPDLEKTDDGSVEHIRLNDLSDEAGAQLLKNVGVIHGKDKELRQASRDFKGHALALTLLGRYLAIACDGDIANRDLIPPLESLPDELGRQACRVIKSYEDLLEGRPELDILYLMGLFDRPADGGAILALLQEPIIDGLTNALCGLSDAKWKYALQRLRDLRLLDPAELACPDTLDCHSLIREHFGAVLKAKIPAAWKEAHSRLYEYFKALPKKHLPDTLDEMEPLFQAVAHGCRAGRHQETLDEVYWERISRKDEYHSTMKLGAFGADLAALSGFFEVPWSQPVAALRDPYKSFILNQAGFDLRALGRLREARQPMQAGLEMYVEREEWQYAARVAGNLSELSLTLGDVNAAVEYARQSVDYADRSGDAFQRESKRTTLAHALHQAGEPSDAEALFREAEAMQQQRQPEYRFLYSLQGFRFCDLLLSQGHFREVQERAAFAIKISRGENWLLNIALDHLSLGRATLLQLQLEKPSAGSEQYRNVLQEAKDNLYLAVQGLREAGTTHHVPRGLLARAELHRVTSDYEFAQRDLHEAREIAERGEMKLHLADYHLESARLCLAQGKPDEAREHLTAASQLVNETGYGRRDDEVAALESQLASV